MSQPIKIDVWSDIACPWCYIGKRRLESALTEFGAIQGAPPVEVIYHSFQLAPDLPEDDLDLGSQREYLSRRKGIPEEQADRMMEQVSGVAASVGLSYDMPAVRMTNTVRAHRLLHLAKEKGLQLEMKERLMAAYFSEGRHLGQVEELVALAGELGIAADDVRRAMSDASYLSEVHADQLQAQRYGIQGVPFFVLDGKYGVSGAQEPAVFLQALTTVHQEQLEEAAA